MNIALANSVDHFFHEAVDEAVRTRQVDATEQATSYLVALLSDFAHPDPVLENTLERPLAFLLDEAFRTTGAERFRRLRALGDSVLYITGFFGDHIENRGVDLGYVTNVGATAYQGAGAMLRVSPSKGAKETVNASGRSSHVSEENVFCELSQKFDQFVEVLTTISESTLAQQARGERGIVRLYERWLRSGSSTLAKELGARGLVPVRGSGGVH